MAPTNKFCSRHFDTVDLAYKGGVYEKVCCPPPSRSLAQSHPDFLGLELFRQKARVFVFAETHPLSSRSDGSILGEKPQLKSHQSKPRQSTQRREETRSERDGSRRIAESIVRHSPRQYQQRACLLYRRRCAIYVCVVSCSLTRSHPQNGTQAYLVRRRAWTGGGSSTDS